MLFFLLFFVNNNISIKVYNKEDNIKLLVNDNKSYKIVTIYKYDKESDERQMYAFNHKKDNVIKRFEETTEGYKEVEVVLEEQRAGFTPYYEFYREVSGICIESLVVSGTKIEHWEVVGDMEEVRTDRSFISGKVWEKRTKRIGDETYESNFEDGKVCGLKFKIRENKINEYLKKQ